MDAIIYLGFIISFVLGTVFLFMSMFVLQAYEKDTKKRPPSVQYWPYSKEMKQHYPRATIVGRILQISTILCALPYLINLIVTT